MNNFVQNVLILFESTASYEEVVGLPCIGMCSVQMHDEQHA